MMLVVFQIWGYKFGSFFVFVQGLGPAAMAGVGRPRANFAHKNKDSK